MPCNVETAPKRASRSSALPPNRNSLASATRTPLAGAQPVQAGGIQRAPRSRLLQTSTLEGAPGTAKAGYAEDPPQGGFGPSAACAVAPQRSTITAERNGFTRPQPLAFAQRLVGTTPQRSASSATAHRQRAICFATQCLHWLVPAAIPRGHPSQRVVGDQGVVAGGLGDLSYFNRSSRRRFGATPAELRHGLRRGLSIDCPRSTSS
jgi:hypothetical protein